jgi:hypothetical protein
VGLRELISIVSAVLLILWIVRGIRRTWRPTPSVDLSSDTVEEPADDPGAWAEFAEGMGLGLGPGPLLRGEVDGRRVRMEAGRFGGISTRLQTFVDEPLEVRFSVVPRDTDRGDPDRVVTDDEDFDSGFAASCRWPALARRLLTPRAREWLLALGDVDVTVSGTVVTAKLPGIEKDLMRLRGLLELALEVARAAEAPEEEPAG